MKLEPIQDLSSWLPKLGETTSKYQNNVHVIIGDYILPVIPVILAYRSTVFSQQIQETSDLVCNEFKGCEEGFHQCLQVLYGADVPITSTNANVLFKFGHVYQIPEMSTQVKNWITSDLQQAEFITTLVSFGDYAPSLFEEFEGLAMTWLKKNSEDFLYLCEINLAKVAVQECEVIITFLVLRIAKKYFAAVTDFVVMALSQGKISFNARFVLNKYKELVSSPDFWKVDFDNWSFSELCSTFNEKLSATQDFNTLMNIVKKTARLLTAADYNNLSAKLVETLTSADTTKDQISHFLQTSSLSAYLKVEIATKWTSLQHEDVVEEAFNMVEDYIQQYMSNDYYNYFYNLYNVNDYVQMNYDMEFLPSVCYLRNLYNKTGKIYSRVESHSNIYDTIFSDRPTLLELHNTTACDGFLFKPRSTPQYVHDTARAYGVHWCLWYSIDDRKEMYSFVTGKLHELENILQNASWMILVGLYI